MINYRLKKRVSLSLAHLILIIECLIVILPILWIFRTSLVHRVLAYRIPPKWIFIPTLENYRVIFKEEPFKLFFANSIIVAVSSTLICLAVGAPAAFSYSRFKTGGNALVIGILATQMLPPITLVIPFFLVYKTIGLYNTRIGLIITYITFNIPFIIWILIGFFQGIPRELDESAMVDGCNRFTAFIRVILPISLPGILSAGVFSFVLSWNEFLFALILTGKRSKTLPVAAVILIILPMVILYFCLRTFLIKGLVAGAVKE